MITDNLTDIVTVAQAGGGMKVGDWITLAAVLVALGLGVASLRQTQMQQKRERRERLLNEIIEWASEIQNAGLKIDMAPNKTQTAIGAEILLRYGIPFSKNDYICQIVKDLFPELRPIILKLTDTFVGFMFLKSKDFGIESPESSFKGTRYSQIIESIKQESNKPENSIEHLLHEYSVNLAYYANELLKKSADRKSRLV